MTGVQTCASSDMEWLPASRLVLEKVGTTRCSGPALCLQLPFRMKRHPLLGGRAGVTPCMLPAVPAQDAALSPACSAVLRPSKGPVAPHMAQPSPRLAHFAGFLSSFHYPPPPDSFSRTAPWIPCPEPLLHRGLHLRPEPQAQVFLWVCRSQADCFPPRGGF